MVITQNCFLGRRALKRNVCDYRQQIPPASDRSKFPDLVILCLLKLLIGQRRVAKINFSR